MLTAMALMQSKPMTVSPDMTLTQLEHLFLTSGFTGFPVLEHDRVVGVVSRSDIVRSLITERSRVEQVSDFYYSTGSNGIETTSNSLEATAAQVGLRIAGLKVEDVMIRNVVTIEPDEPVQRLAQLMFEGHFHRLLVVDHGRLVGVITTMDLVQAIAEGRFIAKDPGLDSEHLLT